MDENSITYKNIQKSEKLFWRKIQKSVFYKNSQHFVADGIGNHVKILEKISKICRDIVNGSYTKCEYRFGEIVDIVEEVIEEVIKYQNTRIPNTRIPISSQ